MSILSKEQGRLERAQHVYRKERAPKPPPGTQIFCGNLPCGMLAMELFPYFSVIGEVYEFRLMMEFSGFSRGFCFVTYTTVEAANQAIRSLHGYVLKERELSVYKSWDNTKLFIYGIPRRVTIEKVRKDLQAMFQGLCNVSAKSGGDQRKKQGNNHRGWAFLEFDNHKNAIACRKQIWPNKLHIWGVEINVEWARPQRPMQERQECSVVLERLPAFMTKNDIYALCKGRIRAASLLQIYKKVGQTYGILEFNTPVCVGFACKMLQGLLIDGEAIQVYKQGDSKQCHLKPTGVIIKEEKQMKTAPITAGSIKKEIEVAVKDEVDQEVVQETNDQDEKDEEEEEEAQAFGGVEEDNMASFSNAIPEFKPNTDFKGNFMPPMMQQPIMPQMQPQQVPQLQQFQYPPPNFQQMPQMQQAPFFQPMQFAPNFPQMPNFQHLPQFQQMNPNMPPMPMPPPGLFPPNVRPPFWFPYPPSPPSLS